MNTDAILRHLTNTGFHSLRTDGNFIYMEDPSCILRSFENFLDYAWIIITAITAVLLFGWAVSMIRGAKNGAGGFFINLRNLIIIFGTLSLVKPAINLIWGDELFTVGCNVIKVPISDIQNVLDSKNLALSTGNDALNTNSDAESNSAWSNLANKLSAASDTVLEASSNYVIYTNPSNGSKYAKVGGSLAWRNTNPGNIRYNKFTRDYLGAIGSAKGFAIFADEQSGMNAIKKLLQTTNYQRLTVSGVISRYAPAFENNTAAYKSQMQKLTGVPLNTPMTQITSVQLDNIANAIKKIEGWNPGIIKKLN